MTRERTAEGERHEGRFVRVFVAERKRARYLELLASRKRRAEFLHELADFSDLDEACAVPIPSMQQTPAGVVAMLRSRGAGTDCWVLSEVQEVDGRLLRLPEAVEAVFGAGLGSVISCIPGELAYYEGEGPKTRWLLEKRGGQGRKTDRVDSRGGRTPIRPPVVN